MADWGFETRQVHAGAEPDPTTGARAVPDLPDDVASCSATPRTRPRCSGSKSSATIYTRIMNPTQAVFEDRMTALEGGVGALATASGQAAQTIALLNLAENGGHIVSIASLYGGTYNQLHYTFPKLGIEVSFVDDPDDLDAWQAAIRPNTKAFYGESIGNPKGDIFDFEGVVEGRARQRHPARHRQHARDRRTCCQPLRHGADIVVHSATKFIGGHGTSIGGIIVDGGKFDYVGERPVPRLHRARPELPRPGVLAAARAAAARAVHPQGSAPVPARHRARDRRRSTRSCSSRGSRR